MSNSVYGSNLLFVKYITARVMDCPITFIESTLWTAVSHL